ncbi:hypothetical protein ACMHYT_29300 [Rhodococcus qingshengii]|uniref:hypothetical protein n=1 Tax=Rhodococcus TaxID=1827 RepID=UPI00106F9741|nr:MULTISPECIES: hypothetical protein [Rhodococcus]MBS2993453.1 hypothetical protein [Rhodococcus erythropolis]MCJ0950465.1 hypothetical protein [Rhodococcus sp. ARC_M8]MCZ4570231.1 hypothetical protein [Rhodococcus erythropolis]MDV8015789.1 hypothetical protein [Rhodococcus sp. IEGM 1241]UGQ55982.1 hypothetical protein LRL17_34475 [Rhodococcus qingshengii]
MSSRKVARESLEDAFSAPSGPGRRGAGLASFLPPSRAPRPSAAAPVRPAVQTPEPRSPAAQRENDAPDPVTTSAPTQPREAVAAPSAPAASAAAPKPAESATDGSVDAADAADAADAVENMPIYIDSATLTALKAEKGRIGGTYADVAEAALDEHIGHVGEILQQGAANKSAGSSLPKRRKSPQIRGGIQVQLRFTKAQRDWLDEKVAEFGAPSRSVVVAVALQLQLGTRAN